MDEIYVEFGATIEDLLDEYGYEGTRDGIGVRVRVRMWRSVLA